MSDCKMSLLWQRIHGLCRLEVKILVGYEGNELKIGDKSFDVQLIIGYTIFNYCNYNL